MKNISWESNAAGSRVSLHYRRCPEGLVWEEVLLTFLLIGSIFKTTILSSSKAINGEVCAGTLRIRAARARIVFLPAEGIAWKPK